MKNLKFNIRYILSKNKTRKDGKAPLMCRITYLDERKQFSVGLFINPKNWNNSLQECESPSNDNNYTNSQFCFLRVEIVDLVHEELWLRHRFSETTSR